MTELKLPKDSRAGKQPKPSRVQVELQPDRSGMSGKVLVVAISGYASDESGVGTVEPDSRFHLGGELMAGGPKSWTCKGRFRKPVKRVKCVTHEIWEFAFRHVTREECLEELQRIANAFFPSKPPAR